MRKLILILTFLISAPAFAQILVDETWGSAKGLPSSSSSPNPSPFGSSTRLGSSSFSDLMSLRQTKKLGLQTTVAGATGLLGFNVEVNATEDLAVSMGVGVSRGFRSFNANMKKFWGGTSFAPYVVGGYSRWFSNGGHDSESTTPAFVAEKFLSHRERETGEFAENLIYPGFGAQYVNTSGDWEGVGFFGEVILLLDLDGLRTAATAGVGSVYYF